MSLRSWKGANIDTGWAGIPDPNYHDSTGKRTGVPVNERGGDNIFQHVGGQVDGGKQMSAKGLNSGGKLTRETKLP